MTEPNSTDSIIARRFRESVYDLAVRNLSHLQMELNAREIANRKMVRTLPDLLRLEGRDFLIAAHRFVLKRDPGQEVLDWLFSWYLAGAPKKVIVAALALSPEAITKKGQIPGWEESLKYRNSLRLWTRLIKFPRLLWLVRWVQGFFLLPLASHQVQLQARYQQLQLGALEDRISQYVQAAQNDAIAYSESERRR